MERPVESWGASAKGALKDDAKLSYLANPRSNGGGATVIKMGKDGSACLERGLFREMVNSILTVKGTFSVKVIGEGCVHIVDCEGVQDGHFSMSAEHQISEI